MDEQWFDLTKETLREALQITPVNRNQAFAAPPSINGLVDFVNQLGYPKEKEGHFDCDSKRSVHQADHPPSSEDAQTHYGKHSSNSLLPGIQENVAKHRAFLAGETRSTQDLPALRPAKPARKPQSTAQKAPPKPSISSPVTTTQPAPISSRSSPKSVGESEAEEVPAEEPQIADEDADFQKAVEETMKDAYALPKGPLPSVVIREPESGKFQPLPEVPGKDKAKVSEEQVAHDLLSLQKHKKTSPADQYIFQRRVSEPTASSFHNTGSDTGAQAKGQAGSNPDETSKGQARSNPDETSEGQAGQDPGNAEARVQSTSSPVVHAGSDREHIDIDVANVSLQPSTEQLYEGFTAMIYPNIQENLKLAVDEPVLLEEPASSSGTLSSLQ
nr:hypothetical protein [Tanacetum cinerariifolium]